MRRLMPRMERSLARVSSLPITARVERLISGDERSNREWSNAELLAMSEAELDAVFTAVAYQDVAATMGTGDLLLLHGTEMYSVAVQFATQSWYSHVAMLLRDPDPPTLALYGVKPTARDPHNLYVLESEFVTEDKRVGGGVQLLPLGTWLREVRRYYAHHRKGLFFLAWRRLRSPAAAGGEGPRPVRAFPHLPFMLILAHEKKYQSDLRTLFKAITHSNAQRDLTKVFCSQLVAWAYISMGLLDDTHNPVNFTPIQFSALYRHDFLTAALGPRGALAPDTRLHVP